MTAIHRKVILWLSLALAMTLIAACGGDSEDEPAAESVATPSGTQAAATEAAGAPSGEQVLRLNLGGEPDTLDPSKASFSNEITVINQLWRGLFTFDEEMELIPAAAAEMPTNANGGIAADGMTYTFKLKPDQVFSDGQPLTSEHFAYALQRAVTPGESGDYASFYLGIKGAEAVNQMDPSAPGLEEAVANIGVRTPDDQTLVVELTEPNAVFLQYMALWPAYPLREDVITEHGDAWIEAGNLIGNGPFVLSEWQHRDHITLTRNEQFSGEAPKLETITLRMIEDVNQAYNAYLAGELDQVSVPSALVKTVQNDPNLQDQYIRAPRLVTFSLGMNNERAPFDNPNVRKAFAAAVDRDALVNGVFQGVNKPALSWLPPGMPGHDAALGEAYSFDPAKAKQLLAEAGFPNGEGLPEITFTYANAGNNPPMAEFIKEQISTNLGVDIQLEPVDSKTLQSRFKENDFQLVFIGWGADYPDPQNFLEPNFKTDAGNNKSNYSNPRFDELLSQAQVESDATQRLDLLEQAHEILVEDQPVAFLFFSERSLLRKPYVMGYVDAPFSAERFWTQVYIQK